MVRRSIYGMSISQLGSFDNEYITSESALVASIGVSCTQLSLLRDGRVTELV